MTVFRPVSQSTVLNTILIGLIVLACAGAVTLIVLYNRMVNLNHGIADLGRSIKTIQAENAEIKDALFAEFSTGNLDRIAVERDLVEDRKPQYLTVAPQWSLASR